MSDDKKEQARKMAAQRAGQAGGRRPLGGQGQVAQPKPSFSFFGEEADGWTMTPKTILLFSVAYMGFVILLHIFSKITHMKQPAPTATPGAEDIDPTGGAESGDL